MPRVVPSEVCRFIASISVIVLLTTHSPALAQQKTTPASPNSQAQLEDRVKELETRLSAAEQKAASATMEKDYITRVQKQYETYYEKAFNTQVATLSIIALFITIVFGLAARFGFAIFDRNIQLKLTEASTHLRTEFNQQLRTELDALRASNAAQLKELEAALTKRIGEKEQDLKARSDYQYQLAQGLAAGADGRNYDARSHFRWALATYKSSKHRQLFEKDDGAVAAQNIFVALEREDKANFEKNAKKELADKLYNDLEDELAKAALTLRWLIPLLNERKLAPSPRVAAEPKTGAVEPNDRPPVPTPKDDK